MANYIPDTEGAFDAFLANFLTVLTANAGALGVPLEQVTALSSARTVYSTNETQRDSAKSTYEGLVITTVTGRDTLTVKVRDLVKVIQLAPGITDTLRRELGITIPKTTHAPVGPPTTVPVLTLSVGMTRQHIIEFADSDTPKTKAKPAGVQGCQIYEMIVPAGAPAPTDPTKFVFLALDTRVPYIVAHDAADIGKTAYYVACWQNAKGDTGPWGQIRAIIIAG